MEKIICPVCGGQGRFRFSKSGFDIYRCVSCGSSFVFPQPADLSAVYGEGYFFNESAAKAHGYTNYDEDKEPMRDLFENFVRKMEPDSSGRRIFDIGAATGYFLDIAKNRGWQTAGSEISEFAAAEARRRGHRVSSAVVEKITGENGYDVVTMWDVLEHVPDPVSTMKAVNRLLKIGGRVAINTVDGGSLLALVLGKRWHLVVPPEHLHFFSKKGLAGLLERTGFEVVEKGRIGKRFTLSYIFKTLHNWQGLSFWRTLSRWTDTPFFRKIFVPINLRDNVFFMARKIKEV